MLTGITSVDQATLGTLMRFTIKTGGNLIVLGNAGVGKTEQAFQAAKACGFDTAYLNLSTLEAPDLIGLPMIDHATKQSEYATPKMLPLKGTLEKPVVLVCDELDKAKQEMQNPMLECFQFRSINGRPLDIVAVISTGNLPDEGAFSLPINKALTNRCMVYKVESAFEPWREWAVKAAVNPLVIGFLAKNSQYLLVPPPVDDDTAYNNPSPRAWTYTGKDLDNAQNESVEFQTLLVAGRVGTAAATAFRVWLEHYRFIAPMIDKLVKDGTKPEINNMTVDRVMVCAISACGAIAQMGRTAKDKSDQQKLEEKITKATKNVFSWLQTIPPDFQIGAAKTALSLQFIQDYKLTRCPELMSVYLKIRSALSD